MVSSEGLTPAKQKTRKWVVDSTSAEEDGNKSSTPKRSKIAKVPVRPKPRRIKAPARSVSKEVVEDSDKGEGPSSLPLYRVHIELRQGTNNSA